MVSVSLDSMYGVSLTRGQVLHDAIVLELGLPCLMPQRVNSLGPNCMDLGLGVLI